jgi:hypothetical protein
VQVLVQCLHVCSSSPGGRWHGTCANTEQTTFLILLNHAPPLMTPHSTTLLKQIKSEPGNPARANQDAAGATQPLNNPPKGLRQARTTLHAQTPWTTSKCEQDIPPKGYSTATSTLQSQDQCRGLGLRSKHVRTHAGTERRSPIS